LSKTILLVTHDAEAANLADRHASLHGGRLVESGESRNETDDTHTTQRLS
jgi:ABC-type proline/glycine betaine transport system ATPase subunit